MSTAIESLRDVVEEGIREELFNAIRSKTLFFEVAKHAQTLNTSGLGELFRLIQDTSIDALTLSITKVFDKTSDHNRTRSIDEALRLLKNPTSACKLRDRTYALKALRARDVPLDQALSDQEIIIQIYTYLENTIRTVKPALLALKEQRDKRIAHKECKIDIADLNLPTWQEVEQLIQVTIDFLDLVGYPFLGKTFVTSGTFVHARDAEGIKEEFQDLMKRMGR